MILCFELSMPNNNSWDGKWSGDGKYYAIVRNMGQGRKATEKAEKILSTAYYHYNFGDGWSAGIKVQSVTSGEAAKCRKKSGGFWGYDWMVDSIIANGKIQTG